MGNTGHFLSTDKDGCLGSDHGCCPDMVTPAKGPDSLGCPESEFKFNQENFNWLKLYLTSEKV